MGSDRHPRPEIEGALLAARHYGVRVLLVGPEERLRKELAGHPTARNLPIDVVNATQVIEMEEKAVQAVRTKKDSSMHVGLRLVREKQAVGFVTAGNTGAAMAAAKMVLGALPGVDRPALASAGRSTPGSAPSTILAAAIAAPVLPAVTNPTACFSRTSRRPTCMLESFLVRTACTAFSSISMTCVAFTTSMGRLRAVGWPASSLRSRSSGPTSKTRTP